MLVYRKKWVYVCGWVCGMFQAFVHFLKYVPSRIRTQSVVGRSAIQASPSRLLEAQNLRPHP